MNPQGGHTYELSPDACQTEIDAVLFSKYERELQPGHISAKDPAFFQITPEPLLAYTWDEDSKVGRFEEIDEQEEFPNTDTRIGNTKTKRMQKWVKQIPVSSEAFLSDKVGKREKIGSQIGDRARLTQDKRAILNTYADAFAGSINTTPNGQPLASNSHATLKNYTADNLETAALDADGLWTTVQSLANLIAQDGEVGSFVFSKIVVPFNLFKTARETLNSELVPFSGENQVNLFDTDYGTVNIGASVYLASGQNSATNASTSYHVLSDMHPICRKIHRDLYTSLIPPENTANDSYIYRARFLEAHFPETYEGYVGNNGTA